MKAEYDFSHGERGKFYRPDVELRLPVYLDEDVEQFLTQVAVAQGLDVQVLVNEWLRSTIKLIQSVQPTGA